MAIPMDSEDPSSGVNACHAALVDFARQAAEGTSPGLVVLFCENLSDETRELWISAALQAHPGARAVVCCLSPGKKSKAAQSLAQMQGCSRCCLRGIQVRNSKNACKMATWLAKERLPGEAVLLVAPPGAACGVGAFRALQVLQSLYIAQPSSATVLSLGCCCLPSADHSIRLKLCYALGGHGVSAAELWADPDPERRLRGWEGEVEAFSRAALMAAAERNQCLARSRDQGQCRGDPGGSDLSSSTLQQQRIHVSRELWPLLQADHSGGHLPACLKVREGADSAAPLYPSFVTAGLLRPSDQPSPERMISNEAEGVMEEPSAGDDPHQELPDGRSPPADAEVGGALLPEPFAEVVLSVADQMEAIANDAHRIVFTSLCSSSSTSSAPLASGTTAESSDALLLLLKEGSEVELRRCRASAFTGSGFSRHHYVGSNPGAHSLCYELVLVNSSSRGGGGGGGGGLHGQQEDNQGEDEEKRLPAPVAFLSVEVDQWQRLPDWLPRPNGTSWWTSVFNVATVARIVVLPAMRGKGAMQLLISLAGAAYSRLGIHLRVTTRSQAAHRSFSRCTCVLKYDGLGPDPDADPQQLATKVGQGNTITASRSTSAQPPLADQPLEGRHGSGASLKEEVVSPLIDPSYCPDKSPGCSQVTILTATVGDGAQLDAAVAAGTPQAARRKSRGSKQHVGWTHWFVGTDDARLGMAQVKPSHDQPQTLNDIQLGALL